MAMENVSYRGQRRSLQNTRSVSAQATACRASEMDFSDVFGGPPRCSSAEVRRSLGHVFHGRSEDAVVPPARFTCPWAAASAAAAEQLPVFGEESPNRRKHLAVDFFDDIFNGVDSNLMSARNSVTASFVASPVHPSLNSGDPPLPRQHSLSNLARKLDSLAADATHASNPNRSPKGVTNTSPWPSYQTRSESETALQPDETLDGCVSQLQTEEAVKETPKENENFHFSIYKWANNGIPLNDAFPGGYRRGSNIACMQNDTSTGSATNATKGEESPSVELLREESGGQETGSAAAETFYSMFSRNDVRIADVGESMPTKSGAVNQPKHGTFIESEEKTKTVQQGRAKKENMPDSGNRSAVDQEKRIEKNLESSENERMLPPKEIPVVAEEVVGSKVKGKVLQFVKMFSHEAPPKPAHKKDTKAPKLKKNPSRRSKVEEKSNDDEVSQPFKQPERPSFSNRESFGKSFDIAVELIEVEDITENQPGHNVATNNQEEIHILDAKIRKWSSGKEGNIRSLLSTLQYVLWAESGWKSVALVDIIEGGAVKRAYQKALLCLHPDKLQQKGATSQQKYIAEKVFDILQDAWTHFNLISSL